MADCEPLNMTKKKPLKWQSKKMETNIILPKKT